MMRMSYVGCVFAACLVLTGCGEGKSGGAKPGEAPLNADAQPGKSPPDKSQPDRPNTPTETVVKTGPAAKVEGVAAPPMSAAALKAGREAALRYMPKDAFAALVLYPQQAVGSPVLKNLPWDKLLEGPTKQSGIDLKTVEQVYMFLRAPQGMARGFGQPIVVSRFVEPIDAEAIAKRQFRGGYDKGTTGGKAHFTEKTAASPTILFVVDERTIVVGQSEEIAPLIAAAPEAAPLAARLQAAPADAVLHAVVLFEPIRGLLTDAMKQAREKGPAMVKQFTELPELLNGVTATVKFDGGTLAELALEGKDEASAKRAGELVDGAVALGRLMYGAARLQMGSSVPESAKPALEVADEAVTGLKVEKQATTVSIRVPTPKSIGKLADMAMPAITDARSRAQQAAAQINLKQIATAIIVYEQANGKLPTDIYSADGKPLLSWRVAILPYLAESPRLEDFRTGEPWDSEHNRKLLEKMPAMYRVDVSAKTDTNTVLQRFSGAGTALDGPRRLTTADLRDGSSNTLLVVAAGADKAVPWTKPADLPFDEANPLAALGKLPDTGLLASFHDGKVLTLPKTLPAATLKALITPSGEERVDLNTLPTK